MQPFDGIQRRNSDPQNARAKMQKIYFFSQRHQRDNVTDAFFRRQIWILERILFGLGKNTLKKHQCQNNAGKLFENLHVYWMILPAVNVRRKFYFSVLKSE